MEITKAVSDQNEQKSNIRIRAAAMARAAADLLIELPGQDARELEDILRVVVRDISVLRIPERRSA